MVLLNGRGDTDKRSQHYHRHFDKMEKYGGKADKWKEWSYQFAMTLGAVDLEEGKLLEAAQSSDMSVASANILMTVLSEGEEKAMKDRCEGFQRVVLVDNR